MLYSVFRLLFEKSCGEVDVFGCNLLASQPLRQVFSIVEAERFIRTFSVQFPSTVGIDMVHHQLYVCLRQFIKASSFRQDPAYKFMSHLDLCFLIRRTWIAVIDPRPLKSFSIRSVLYTLGIGLLTVPVTNVVSVPLSYLTVPVTRYSQNHVTRYQFHYWKRLVKEAAIEQMLPEIVPLPLSTPDTDSSHTGFPCRATSASSAASSCDEPAHSSVSLKVNGISLELDPSTPTDFLIKLMKAVSQC